MRNSDRECCGCFLAFLVCVSPFILIPIGSVIINRHHYVDNLPIGMCHPTNGTIYKTDSGAIILHVPINNMTVDMHYPPPPTMLNIKSDDDVKEWIDLVTISPQGIRCHYDKKIAKAWTESINMMWGIIMLCVGLAILVIPVPLILDNCCG